MSYKISFESKPNYLHVTVSGENTRQNVVACLADMRKGCEARDCFRVLIEERLEGPCLDSNDVFDIASQASIDALGIYGAVA
jgi:hypothetical protein